MSTATQRRTATGRLTVVQEDRFHLVTDGGQTFRLTLSHHANLDGAALCRLKDNGTHVTVEYTGEPGLASGVAHRVRAA